MVAWWHGRGSFDEGQWHLDKVRVHVSNLRVPYFTVLIVMYRDRALGCKPIWTSIVESGATFVFI